MTPSEHLQAGTESANELLARRTQLQEWLGRLDEVGGDIPAQVARRVRADYEQRLAAVVAELSAHSESLSADRERLDERLLAAAERHDAATDALEEARLRHLIGELSEEDWNDRRPDLEAELESAAGERDATEREISALEDLFTQISASPTSDETTLEAGSPPALDGPGEQDVIASVADFAEAAEEWDPELPMLQEDARIEPAAPESEPWNVAAESAQPSAEAAEPARSEEAPEAGAAAPEEAAKPSIDHDLVEITNFAAAAEALADEVDPPRSDDDYAFLEELDRAIAATSPSAPADEEEPSAETRPQPGLKCPDCGYSNDPAAWYCGVCGVDLA